MTKSIKGIGLGLCILALAGTCTPALATSWGANPWDVYCDNPNPCWPASEVYEQLLAQASQWLDGLGFAAPKILPQVDNPNGFQAYVDDEYLVQGKEAVGKYNNVTSYLALSSENFFTMGEPGQTFEDPNFQWETSYEFTPVHELFHAVENAYQEGTPRSDKKWIFEGMADAVKGAYFSKFEPEIEVQMISRVYAVPLHDPGQEVWEYGTWHFWAGMGKQLGSQDKIAYLKDVLSQDLSQNHGLDGVDRALPGGLATQLPLFFSGLGLEKFDENNSPKTVDAALPPGDRRADHPFPLHVREVAGRGVAVKVETPTGEPVEVRFTLEPDLPDFHLIVDGEVMPERFAAYQLPDGGTRIYKVVVANVASPASASQDRDVELKVSLSKPVDHCSMWARVSGDVSGTQAGDVAYFNFFREGVKEGLAGGTALDPTAHEALEGLMEFAQWANDFLEDDDEGEEGESAEAGDTPQKESKPTLLEAMEAEWDLSGNDNFGLALVAVSLADEAAPEVDPLATGGFGGAMNILGSTFSLSASGRSTFDPESEEAIGKGFTVEPSFVAVAPGAMDANFSGVKFLWKPGLPGHASLLFRYTEAGVIVGQFAGELYTERKYDNGRRLKIEVDAEFTALQGAFSCQ